MTHESQWPSQQDSYKGAIVALYILGKPTGSKVNSMLKPGKVGMWCIDRAGHTD